jgi:hypothetical protein
MTKETAEPRMGASAAIRAAKRTRWASTQPGGSRTHRRRRSGPIPAAGSSVASSKGRVWQAFRRRPAFSVGLARETLAAFEISAPELALAVAVGYGAYRVLKKHEPLSKAIESVARLSGKDR